MIKLLEQLKDGRDNYKNSNDYVTPVGPEPGLVAVEKFNFDLWKKITDPIHPTQDRISPFD